MTTNENSTNIENGTIIIPRDDGTVDVYYKNEKGLLIFAGKSDGTLEEVDELCLKAECVGDKLSNNLYKSTSAHLLEQFGYIQVITKNERTFSFTDGKEYRELSKKKKKYIKKNNKGDRITDIVDVYSDEDVSKIVIESDGTINISLGDGAYLSSTRYSNDVCVRSPETDFLHICAVPGDKIFIRDVLFFVPVNNSIDNPNTKIFKLSRNELVACDSKMHPEKTIPVSQNNYDEILDTIMEPVVGNLEMSRLQDPEETGVKIAGSICYILDKLLIPVVQRNSSLSKEKPNE